MSDETKLDIATMDVDGALGETAYDAATALEAEGDTRAGFFKKAGIAGGAALGSSALLTALVPGAAEARRAGAPPAGIFGKGDIGILNYALTLEYLEAAFYNEATANQRKRAFTKDKQIQVFLKTVTRDENIHVAALKKALGNKAAAKPKFGFGTKTSKEGAFVATATLLENTGVGAYSGQAFNITSPKVLATALSIVTVEARHASVIGLIGKANSQGITPNGPFDEPLTAKQVIAGVKATNFVKEGPLR